GDEGHFWLTATDDTVRATTTRFLNRLNGFVVKPPRRNQRAASSIPQPRLDALVWLERGSVGRRFHLHALIERPRFWPPEAFAAKVKQAWHAQPLAYRQARIEELRDLARSLRYNAKGNNGTS